MHTYGHPGLPGQVQRVNWVVCVCNHKLSAEPDTVQLPHALCLQTSTLVLATLAKLVEILTASR